MMEVKRYQLWEDELRNEHEHEEVVLYTDFEKVKRERDEAFAILSLIANPPQFAGHGEYYLGKEHGAEIQADIAREFLKEQADNGERG